MRPAVSVIIPAYNATDTLEKCVKSVLSQTVKAKEIIIVDDNSNTGYDGVAKLAKSIKLIRNEVNLGPASGRNAGAKLAKGDILLFCDADVIFKVGVIKLLTDLFMRNSDVEAVNGVFSLSENVNLIGKFINLSIMFKHKTVLKTTFWPFTSFFAIYKNLFFELEEFDEFYSKPFEDDVSFRWKLIEGNHTIFREDRIEIIHLKKYSIKSFLKHRFFVGFFFVESFFYNLDRIKRKPKEGVQKFFYPLNVLLASLTLLAIILPIEYKIVTVVLLFAGFVLNNIQFLMFGRRYHCNIFQSILFLALLLLESICMLLGVLQYIGKRLLYKAKREVVFLRYSVDYKRNLIFNKYPSFWTVFVTSACNYRCPHCLYYSEISHLKKELDIKEWETIIQKLPKFPKLLITGGEPFLLEKLPFILKYFNSFCYVKEVTITSNGSRSVDIYRTLKEILKSKLFWKVDLQLSLDGPPEIHDKIRKKGAFNRVMHTYRLTERFMSKYPEFTVRFCFTLMQENQDCFERVLKILEDIRYPDMNIVLVRGNIPNPEQLNIKIESYIKAVKLLVRYMKKKRRGLFALLFIKKTIKEKAMICEVLKGNDIGRCYAGEKFGIINEKGEVFFCELYREKVLGNLLTGGFKDIWLSDYATKLRKSIRENRCKCTFETAISIKSLPLGEFHLQ